MTEAAGDTRAVVDNSAEHRYEIRAGDELAGFIEYRARPGLIAMIHTEVDDRFEGQGIGSKLVAGALGDARERASKCSRSARSSTAGSRATPTMSTWFPRTAARRSACEP